MLRLINSLLAAISVLLLLVHGLLAAAFLAGLLSYTPVVKDLGWAFLIAAGLHAGLSCWLFLFYDRPRPRFPYARTNSSTWLQRGAGLALAILTLFHLNEAYGHVTMTGWYLPHSPTWGRFALEALLLLATAWHLWFSLPRLSLSLGLLRREEDWLRWRTACRWGAALVFLLILAALSCYFLIPICTGQV